MYQYPYKYTPRTTCEFGAVGSWTAGFHIGVDYVGDTTKEIYPIYQGTVQSISDKGKAYGNHIVIMQDDGLVALYAHLDKIFVAVGDKVTKDTIIGIEGGTGNVTGNHLHLELHEGAYKYPIGYSSASEVPWLEDPDSMIKANMVSDWASSSWANATSAGITDGERPRDTITRQEVIVMLERCKLF